MALRPVDPTLLVRGTNDDPRLGRCAFADAAQADVIIIGCADDTGVANGGGRVGAAEGPTEIRRWLYRQTTGLSGELASLQITDLGDVLPGESIEATHQELETTIARIAKSGTVIVFLGGGHDLSYASQAGLFAARPGRGGIVSVSSRLNAAPSGTITSSTPFRRLYERCGARLASFVAVGAQPQHIAKSHADYVRSKYGRVTTLEELRQAPGVVERMKRELGATAGNVDFAAVSLDLGVASAAFAPGVSAPPADGLNAEELTRFCDWAGRNPRVTLLEVVEVAPPYDENGKTARLAALCIWRFFAGIAAR
jgi:formimidoylglutamase